MLRSKRFREWIVENFIGWYPPFLGAGVSVVDWSTDWTSITVQMKLRWYNKNYVGTHFGGSLYSMCDPWLMFLMMKQLGPGYIVWDKAAAIRFKKPGRGRVTAKFTLEPHQVEEVREQLQSTRKVEPMYTIEVLSDEGEVIAEVDKVLYIRKKEEKLKK